MKTKPGVTQKQFWKIQQHLFTTLLLALMAIALQANYSRQSSFTTKLPQMQTPPVSEMTQLKALDYSHTFQLRLIRALRQWW